MLKLVFSAFLLLGSTPATAVQTIVNKPTGSAKGLVVIAPAKKYLMHERLFSSLAETLTNRGFITVRFNWASETFQNPQLEIQKAAKDIQNVISSAQKEFGFTPEQTTLISKSFSTKAIDSSLSLAKSHILLTPNCSAEAPFHQTYKNILQNSDIHLKMIISVDDPYCDVAEINQTLNAIDKPQLLMTTKGDHNFVISQPSTCYAYQDFVVESVTDFVTGFSKPQPMRP